MILSYYVVADGQRKRNLVPAVSVLTQNFFLNLNLY